jgi:FdhD protein
MSSVGAIKPAAAAVIELAGPRNQLLEVVVEEPLEIRVAGDPVSLTMRTPGDDRFLALGFLFTEGVIRGLQDVGSVHHCGRSDDPAYGNAIDVLPGAGVVLDAERLLRARRDAITSSACGVCGRAGIDDLRARAPRPEPRTLDAACLFRVPALLAAYQPTFARTGGAHAACAVGANGEVLAHAEDVGRHNAVDKVIGKLLYAGLLDDTGNRASLLAVSGRASFEIVQKAAIAGFLCVASVSAPSSLAIEAASESGLTLASFVRDQRFTLYAHPERVTG